MRLSGNIALCFVVLALAAGAAHARADEPAKAAKIKSAYLLNFMRYAEWPASSFSAADQPLSLCVVGRDTLSHHLDRTMRGQSVRGRAISVRRFDAPFAATAGCHLLFISESVVEHAPAILARHTHAAALTVGETVAFVEIGAMLALNRERDRIVFYANREAIRSSRVHLSSKILQLARTGASDSHTASN